MDEIKDEQAVEPEVITPTPAPAKRRGRPSKAELAERAAKAVEAAKTSGSPATRSAVIKAVTDSPDIMAAMGLGPEDKEKFVAILWSWIHRYEESCEPVYERDKQGRIKVDNTGQPIRDYRLELRRQELASAMAQRAAQLLRVAFINEKVEIEKPSELPLKGLPGVVTGWFAGADSEKGDKFDA